MGQEGRLDTTLLGLLDAGALLGFGWRGFWNGLDGVDHPCRRWTRRLLVAADAVCTAVIQRLRV
jgi:hypothetical protein